MDQALTATRAQDLNPDAARRWLDEWNRQQDGYVRFRDCRFEIIADALAWERKLAERREAQAA